ncbi:hypothetical protein CGK40_19815 [Vibrio parahaemolyticus]|uniref:hypothetical protein n=1 Tax=Vibrio parahaemolyticus TaxID=670 RepID=UPI0011226C61|nr:hypothetical protein [Vibrio parahaemolyticus]TNZ90870.1 hypothetical protein CGK40_19815 [Vibrio parahaemolyticus]
MSNEIKRFNPEPMGQMAVMFEVEDGGYVEYEDYLLLRGKHNTVMRDFTSLQMIPKSEHDSLSETNKKLAAYCNELAAKNRKLESVLSDILAIVDESDGVAGYHLDGQIAEWGEFSEIEAAEILLEGEQK